MAFAACSTDKTQNGEGTPRSVSVTISDSSTRASDDPVTGGTASLYDNLYIYFTDGNQVLFCDVIAERDSVEAFRTDGKVYENITSSVSEVMILANVKPSDALPTVTGTAVEDIVNYPFGLASRQPGSLHPENGRTGGLKVTLFGSGRLVEQEGATVSGLKKMKAEVAVAPVVARIEIYGTPTPSTGIHSLKITKGYLNGYYTVREFLPENYVCKGENIYDYGENVKCDAALFSQDNLSPDGVPVRVDAHHLFSDGNTVALPHLVLETEGAYDDGAGNAGQTFAGKYITVTSYREVSAMVAGNVYKIDLSLLSITADMLDPVPEAGRIALEIAVEIEAWNDCHSSPEI